MTTATARQHEETLLACAIYAPRLLPRVRIEFNSHPPEDEALARVWNALLATEAAFGRTSAFRVADLLAGDSAASAALAGLPDAGPFDEMLADALRSRAALRGAARGG